MATTEDTPPRATPRVAGSGASSSGPPRPKTTGAKKAPPKAPPRPKQGIPVLKEQMANQLTMLGMAVGQGDPVGGFILISNAEPFAETWGEVAAVNPRVKAILDKWFSASVYANAGAASLAIVLPLATHYGLMPRAWFNPVVPAVEAMEGMVNGNAETGQPPMSLADLLRLHEASKAAAAAFNMEDFASAAAGDGVNGAGQ